MYQASYFKASDYAEVLAFMKAHPFVIVCGVDENNFPVATHVPVLMEERNEKLFLTGHVMRKQQHSIAFEQNEKVLTIFSGAHSYISASWYETKNVASTWNYQAVHAKGILHWMNEEKLHELLVKLTNHFEGDEHSAASVKNMGDEYVQKHIKAIAGFEIEVTELDHVFKLSQNRDVKSYENITAALNKGTDEEKVIAAEMSKRKDKILGK